MTDIPLFRTVVDVPKSPSEIAHGQRILCVGSCFAENIGGRLKAFRFNACVNPTGILFNPFSMAKALSRLFRQEPYVEKDLFFADGVWRSWDHHGRFSAASKEECLKTINAGFEEGGEAVKHCDVLILTFGTAFVYQLTENGKIVANCHKQPDGLFTRKLLSVEEIVRECKEILGRVYRARPQCLCVATISPVRHLRDDPHENLVSKSTLACAVHELQKEFSRLYYFPAYEIMMDELRDYRFYEKDMAHPNEVAIDYIGEKFVNACVDEKSRQFIGEYEKIKNAMAHRISQHPSEETKKFAREQLGLISGMEKEYPGVPMDKEREYFSGLYS
jgi:hypothetical protein